MTLHLTSCVRADGYSATEARDLAHQIDHGELGGDFYGWTSIDDILTDRERDLIVAALRAFA